MSQTLFDEPPMPYLINGEARDTLSIHDRGLHYGDGLFETMAVVNGALPLWERHMARLCSDASRLGIPPPDPALLQAEAAPLCAGVSRGVLKIILTRGEGRGYRIPQDATPTRILYRYPWPAWPASYADHGVRARICDMRLASNPRLAGIKHLNRLEQVLARSEWQDEEITEGLLMDQAGHVIEGTQSNLFIVREGRLLTPLLSQCGVAGVMRDLIMAEAQRLAITCEERELRLAQVLEADEVFLCNSLMGIWPVRVIGEVTYPDGEITRRLAQHVRRLQAV